MEHAQRPQEKVMKFSRIPPLLCVGELTCCTSPNVWRYSLYLTVWGSTGFSKWILKSPNTVMGHRKITSFSKHSVPRFRSYGTSKSKNIFKISQYHFRHGWIFRDLLLNKWMGRAMLKRISQNITHKKAHTQGLINGQVKLGMSWG